jgi:hypothetical protein
MTINRSYLLENRANSVCQTPALTMCSVACTAGSSERANPNPRPGEIRGRSGTHNPSGLRSSQHGPVEREIIKVIAEQGPCTLDYLRAEVSRRLRLRRWLSKPEVRTAIRSLAGVLIATQESMGRPWSIRLAGENHGLASTARTTAKESGS